MHALIGAYSQDGEAWLDGLKEVLSENVAYATAYIREHFEGVELFQPEGTYMLFIDCEKWLAAHGKTLDEVLAAGVKVGCEIETPQKASKKGTRPFYDISSSSV